MLRVLIILAAGLLARPVMSQPDQYCTRRQAVYNTMPASSVLVMRSADAPGHIGQAYIPCSDFFFLTGRKLPGEYLIMVNPPYVAGGNPYQSLLFCDASPQVVCGEADTILAADQFRNMFNLLLKGKEIVFLSAPDLGLVSDWPNAKPFFNERESNKRLKERFPEIRINPASRLIHPHRMIKSPEEIEAIRHSIAITRNGLENAMRHCRPGITEFQLQALLESQFLYHGCQATAFHSIVASGANALDPHYHLNRDTAHDGQLVKMDVGARCGGYCADITRTFPVNGKFSPEQAWLYQTILDCQKELIAEVKPGMTLSGIDKNAREIFRRSGLQQYLIHGVTHSLGLNVHDPQPSDTLRPGMVITIEPGLYIPVNDTTYPGLSGTGIRIEDDVLVTDHGCEVLSEGIIREIADIEAFMKQR